MRREGFASPRQTLPKLPAGVGAWQALKSAQEGMGIPKEGGSDSRGVCAPPPVQPPCRHHLLLADSHPCCLHPSVSIPTGFPDLPPPIAAALKGASFL